MSAISNSVLRAKNERLRQDLRKASKENGRLRLEIESLTRKVRGLNIRNDYCHEEIAKLNSRRIA